MAITSSDNNTLPSSQLSTSAVDGHERIEPTHLEPMMIQEEDAEQEIASLLGKRATEEQSEELVAAKKTVHSSSSSSHLITTNVVVNPTRSLADLGTASAPIMNDPISIQALKLGLKYALYNSEKLQQQILQKHTNSLNMLIKKHDEATSLIDQWLDLSKKEWALNILPQEQAAIDQKKSLIKKEIQNSSLILKEGKSTLSNQLNISTYLITALKILNVGARLKNRFIALSIDHTKTAKLAYVPELIPKVNLILAKLEKGASATLHAVSVFKALCMFKKNFSEPAISELLNKSITHSQNALKHYFYYANAIASGQFQQAESTPNTNFQRTQIAALENVLSENNFSLALKKIHQLNTATKNNNKNEQVAALFGKAAHNSQLAAKAIQNGEAIIGDYYLKIIKCYKRAVIACRSDSEKLVDISTLRATSILKAIKTIKNGDPEISELYLKREHLLKLAADATKEYNTPQADAYYSQATHCIKIAEYSEKASAAAAKNLQDVAILYHEARKEYSLMIKFRAQAAFEENPLFIEYLKASQDLHECRLEAIEAELASVNTDRAIKKQLLELTSNTYNKAAECKKIAAATYQQEKNKIATLFNKAGAAYISAARYYATAANAKISENIIDDAWDQAEEAEEKANSLAEEARAFEIKL